MNECYDDDDDDVDEKTYLFDVVSFLVVMNFPVF